MSGMSDYSAENYLNDMASVVPCPTATLARYLALLTTAPTSDAGTGGTEVSGTGYARVQVAGTVTVSGSSGAPSTGSATITLSASAPAWVTALGTNGSGCNVYDTTAGKQIGTISSVSGTTITLTGNASNNGSLSDTLLISAFGAASASSGNEPSTTPASITNGAVINFAQIGSGGWGTITSFGLYDALTSGNLRGWDYLGNYKWIPFSCTSASPGVLTCDSTGDAPANSSSIVVSAKYGGTLPATSGSWAGLLTTANLSGATFTAGVNTTGIGGGQFRQVGSQATVANVTLYYPASSLTISGA